MGVLVLWVFGSYCGLFYVVVICVGIVVVYFGCYCGILVGLVCVGCCSCYLFLSVWRIFICLSMVFCIDFSVLFKLSGGVYLDNNAYFF
jgi:hypothetical protein